MDADALLQRFDGRSKLLLRCLLGVGGVRRALWVFHRQQRSEPDLFIHSCLDTLCQVEPCLDGETLSLRPLVCLFPVAFKRSLLSFLHVAHLSLPRPELAQLLHCLCQDPHHDAWVQALLGQLRRDLHPEACREHPLVTSQCRERLEALSTRLGLCNGRGNGGRISWFGEDSGSEPQWTGPGLSGTERPKKRTSELAGWDVDSEGAMSQNKRRRLDQGQDTEDGSPSQGLELQPGGSQLPVAMDTVTPETVAVEDATEPQQISPVVLSELPEHVKASVPRIRELLETEWDAGSSSVLQVLNECDPPQVELLCAALCLPDVAEQALPQFSTALLELSPDLSFSTASALIRSLFLGKVLSLSEPASRCLVTAVTSLGSRYPRPTCCALIGPVLEAGQTGCAQAELLCRLTTECLEPHYQLQVFGQTLAVPWTEGVLSVIHSLLDCKLQLDGELFSRFTARLSQQAPQFGKSMKFSKMVLTVLTKYHCLVNAAHRCSLANCLDQIETFLKKSLQAALKRISP